MDILNSYLGPVANTLTQVAPATSTVHYVGMQGPAGVIPDNVVLEWTDSDNNGTEVVVGMLALKLWDDTGEVYRDLDLVGNQLNFDGDPVALEDNGASSLRRGGIILYDSVGDGDYLVTAANGGLYFNSNLIPTQEDVGQTIGVGLLKIYDGPGGEWSELRSYDGQLQYTSVVSGFTGTRNVVVNVNKTNSEGIQGFVVNDNGDDMLTFNVASQGIEDGFPLCTLEFSAEIGFLVSQSDAYLWLTAATARLANGDYIFDVTADDGYVVSESANFRAAISAAPAITEQLWDTPGNYTFTFPTWAKYCDLLVVGGGGGGGSGCKRASGTATSGGAGGTSGQYLFFEKVPVSLFGYSLLNVTVGSGGTGALGVSTDNTDGLIGTAGTNSLFSLFLPCSWGCYDRCENQMVLSRSNTI